MMNLKTIFQKIRAENFIRRTYPDLEGFIIKPFLENYGYTMPISLLVKLSEITTKLKLQLVIEFGSGVSTILLVSNLKNTGGKMIVFDESLKWINNTYKKCLHIDNTLFIFVPAKEKINYQTIAENINFNKKTDLLIIDGPSRDRFTENARKLYDLLMSTETICVIDDTDREINEIEAKNLAKKHKLQKVDYKDPLYTKHKYSILYPQSIGNKGLLE